MPEVPDEIAALVRQRQDARAARDFARADALRDKIDAAGYLLTDTPAGPVAEPKPAYARIDPATIADTLSEPATTGFSFHVLYEGFLDDLARFLASFAEHNDTSNTEVVVVDNASDDGAAIEEACSRYPFARVVHLDRALGWAGARNAGLKGSAGEIVVLVDLSIEPTGDVCGPLADAFGDDRVGVAGPFGLTSRDMRAWEDSPGPEVDAIEGYLLATRRDLLARGLVHEKFAWYRNADIDLSFQLRSHGAKAVVVPVPVAKHLHRGWNAVDDVERARLSKRNHYTFFGRWKHHTEMLTTVKE